MSQTSVGRRDFITGVGVGTASVTLTALAPLTPAEAQAQAAVTAVQEPAAGYTYLKPAEAAFIEAVAGSWGKGDRLYMQGPWAKGTANQGYQLPLAPAELYRVSIQGSNAYCRKTYRADFNKCSVQDKETFLKDLSTGKITFEGGLPGRAFFTMLYDNVMEGMFADPIYGGNKDKVGWKMIGFPGVMANNAENVKKFNEGQRFAVDPTSIADMS
jgi:gluconate 2-dehydrogenase gamma chain